jgi:hypothetical protein
MRKCTSTSRAYSRRSAYLVKHRQSTFSRFSSVVSFSPHLITEYPHNHQLFRYHHQIGAGTLYSEVSTTPSNHIGSRMECVSKWSNFQPDFPGVLIHYENASLYAEAAECGCN